MKKAYDIQIYGIVQGVGFRPFVFKLAEIWELAGWVQNKGGAVHIHIEGMASHIKPFILSIIHNPPSLAEIQEIKIQKGVLYNDVIFEIKLSKDDVLTKKFLPADVATCEKCMAEVRDSQSNRYQYAFTNCTECGPRYSIIKRLPYDRRDTTMEVFLMCETCLKEYEDPKNRRFHAQPNGCIHCGPTLKLVDCHGQEVLNENPIHKTVSLIKAGAIVAIKGIGGFHLCCDATNQHAVSELRRRKGRRHKPFAIMASDINAVKKICEVTYEEEAVLMNRKRPIVLLSKKQNRVLCSLVAPYLNKVGVMLPYTPLHFFLLEKDISYIVMTSANQSEKTICYKNEEALCTLHDTADYFLFHNRNIFVPIDDSVVKVVHNREVVSRIGRGYGPKFFRYNGDLKQYTILGVGAEQKVTFAIMQDGYTHISPYIGDVEDLENYEYYIELIQHFKQIFKFSPTMIAYDYHPDYLTTRYVLELKIPSIPVQHHHAHMVSCMVEHGLKDAVIGVIYDGTGYGLDGAVWGGEFLVGTRSHFQRIGHLQYTTLQGGALAIKEIWRSAVGFLWSMGIDAKQWVKGVDSYAIDIVQQALNVNFNCFKTSSMGRLFDCVAALIGIRNTITYDAQGAIELEACMDKMTSENYPYQIVNTSNCFEVQYGLILQGILGDIQSKVPVSVISAKFHRSICNCTIDMVIKISGKTHIKDIILGGGVFENNYLLEKISEGLEERGFSVFHNEQVPINDSGISLGQVAVAQAKLSEEGDYVLSYSREN